jgi:hypothetical protein
MNEYKTIIEDFSTGNLYFGYTKDDEVKLVSYSMWEKLDYPIKENDNFKKIKFYLLKKLSFNKQVEFNIAVKSLKDITELDKIRLLHKLNPTLPKISKKGIKVIY